MEPVKLYKLVHTSQGHPANLIYFIFLWTAVIHNVWGWGQGLASSSRAFCSVVKVSWYWDKKLHFLISHLDEIQPSRTKTFQRWTGGQTPFWACYGVTHVFLSLSSILSCLPQHALGPLISSCACLEVSHVFLSMSWGPSCHVYLGGRLIISLTS